MVDESGEPVTVRPLKVAKAAPAAKTTTRASRSARGKPAPTRAAPREDAQKRAMERQRAELEDRLREVEAESGQRVELELHDRGVWLSGVEEELAIPRRVKFGGGGLRRP